VTRSEAVLLLAVVGFVTLLVSGTVGVEVHRLLVEVARELQTVAA
jgi:hypothetical protein